MPGLWTLGFLLLCGACVLVWLGSSVCVFGYGFPLRPPKSWPAFVVCVFGLGFCFHPANPGWGVCARVLALPRQMWLGFVVCVCVLVCWPNPTNPGWGVLVSEFVCAFRLYPANPGLGVRCGRVYLGSGFGYALPFLARVLGCVCLCARSACTQPIQAAVCVVCVLVRVLAFTLPILARVLGCVCLPARSTCTLPFLAGMYVVACVVGLWSRLRPATPGWGVDVCVVVCAFCLYPANPNCGVRC